MTISRTTRFTVTKFNVLSTQCIYVFCMHLRIDSDYFPIQKSESAFLSSAPLYWSTGRMILIGKSYLLGENPR